MTINAHTVIHEPADDLIDALIDPVTLVEGARQLEIEISAVPSMFPGKALTHTHLPHSDPSDG